MREDEDDLEWAQEYEANGFQATSMGVLHDRCAEIAALGDLISKKYKIPGNLLHYYKTKISDYTCLGLIKFNLVDTGTAPPEFFFHHLGEIIRMEQIRADYADKLVNDMSRDVSNSRRPIG